MASKLLLEQFPPVSTAEWEAAIARDLKGADYEKKLVWRTDEGLAVKPYYRVEDLLGAACLDAAAGEFPYRRGGRASGDWQIREEIDATNVTVANSAALAAVAAGAEGIALSCVQIETGLELDALLVNLSEAPVHFEHADEQLIGLLIQRLRAGQHAGGFSTGCDALTNLEFAAKVVREVPAGIVPFTIHGEAFEEAGATAAEEIGLSLAAGLEFLAAMQQRGLDVNCAAQAIEFSFAAGSNYFFQIAKLRGFRMVWARAVESFGGTHDGARTRIAARTSRWNKTVYDPQVNSLRATTEAMAAVLGGADSVTVAPFDDCYKGAHEASRRLARNTQLLLKNEAWLGRVADAGGGSYYLEAITEYVAEQGWKCMQEIEAHGGFRKAQAEDVIAGILERSMAAREKAVNSRRRVLVGTNHFANPGETALDRADLSRMVAKKRGALMYEQLRLRTERHAAASGMRPRVVLAEIGNAKMRAARSNFASNFFACAGFEIETKRFNRAEETADAIGDLIVLCSADEEYAALAAALIPRLKAQRRGSPVIVAGNPENVNELRAAGIADFVHVRSNPIEMLTKWQERLGIKGS